MASFLALSRSNGPAPPPPHFLDQCGPEMHPPSPRDWNRKWLALWRGDSFRKSSSSAFQRFICFMFQISIYQPGNRLEIRRLQKYAFRLSPCTMTFVATNVAFLDLRQQTFGAKATLKIVKGTLLIWRLHRVSNLHRNWNWNQLHEKIAPKSCGAWTASKRNLL